MHQLEGGVMELMVGCKALGASSRIGQEMSQMSVVSKWELINSSVSGTLVVLVIICFMFREIRSLIQCVIGSI